MFRIFRLVKDVIQLDLWKVFHVIGPSILGVHLLLVETSPGSFPTSRGKKAFSIDTYPILTGSLQQQLHYQRWSLLTQMQSSSASEDAPAFTLTIFFFLTYTLAYYIAYITQQGNPEQKKKLSLFFFKPIFLTNSLLQLRCQKI